MKQASVRRKSVHIINLGCSKNTVDSENILGDFSRRGFDVDPEGGNSDVVVINTCGFIRPAKEESIETILDVVHSKKPHQKIVVAGCLSERYKEELQKEIPEVDLFYGTYRDDEIARRIHNEFGMRSTGFTGDNAAPRRIFLEPRPHHAYLKIAEGCNRQCGFCAIPGIRGRQNSRKIADLVREAQDLQKRGVVEVSLVAQDLTFFGREKGADETLELLLMALVRETDIPWFRLMYAYPAFLDDSLLELIAGEKRICNYVDMPLQHSSSHVLKAMRRGYTGEALGKTIQRLRASIPNLSLRTTVLVGYPGETDKDYEELLGFVRAHRFERLGGFPYSEEEGTYAGDNLTESNVPAPLIQERLERLMEIQQNISLDMNQKLVGKTLEVLIDGPSEEGSEFQFIGRTEGDALEVDHSVFIRGEGAVPGTFRQVCIEQAWEFDLEGKLL